MYDYLIIGQGLAGTILSYCLLKKGNRVLVINNHDLNCPSYIAAGIFSPITGQRIAKIWQADKAFPYIHSLYPELEHILNIRFFYSMPYIKLIKTEKLKNQAITRLQDPAYQSLFEFTTYNGHPALHIHNAGYVDIPVLLNAYRTYLTSINAYREEWFDVQQLIHQGKFVAYKNLIAKYVIFCNGLQAGMNNYFNYVQFNPTKGQLLTIRMDFPLDSIISDTIFVLPIGNNLFHVGATFERNYTDTHPTKEAKIWLTKELQNITTKPYEIIAHKTGIRPTTLGHYPYTEWHHIYDNVGIFSGFGSKGVSLIPYLSHMFTKA